MTRYGEPSRRLVVSAIDVFRRYGPQTPNELARHLNISRRSASHCLKYLTKGEDAPVELERRPIKDLRKKIFALKESYKDAFKDGYKDADALTREQLREFYSKRIA